MKKEIKLEDIIAASLFCITIASILFGYWTAIIDQTFLKKIILFANIAFPMYLFLWYFERLRIWWIFLFWVIAGLIYLLVSIYLTNSGNFKSAHGNYTDGGLSIFAALLAFLFGHILNHIFFKRNFMAAAWFSPNHDRRRDVFDFAITFIGMVAIIISWDVTIEYP